MADVAVDTQSSNPKELYGQGVRAYVLQDYDTAVRAFSTASELLAKEHNDDLHDSLGEIYLYYGKSLLELSRREGGPLGEGVLKNVEEESESEDNEEVEAENGDNNDNDNDNDKSQADETKADEAKPTENGDTESNKPAEESTVKAESDTKPEEAGPSESKEGEETEDELTDLQVAWEVLELAKKIFIKRENDGRKYLAETLIVLGEISLESGNFASAIDDMKEGLELQKKIFGNDSRTIAETYYKLGGALSVNAQIDEAIESFNSSLEYLKNRIATLKKDGEVKDGKAEELKELDELIPEIEEKIADMKSLKQEVSNKISTATVESVSTNGAGPSPSSSKAANDISHLVKRKRKPEDGDAKEAENLNPAKKPTP